MTARGASVLTRAASSRLGRDDVARASARAGGPGGVRRPAPVTLLALVAVTLCGCTGHPAAPGSPPATGTSAGARTASPSATPSPSPSTAALGHAAATQPSVRAAAVSASVPAPADAIPAPARRATPVPAALRPTRVVIPAIGVDTPLVDLGITPDGSIEVPVDWRRAGWLDTSSAPGQQGPAVIAGHVDSREGPAVFARLAQLRPGDAVTVDRADGATSTYTVDGVRSYPKASFPTEATYGPVPGPVLRLITCGGSYVRSRGGYLDNVVVFAS